MRFAPTLIACAALAGVAAPLAAQDRAVPGAEMAARLADPRVQDALAASLGAMTGALLDMRVGPLARLATPDADIRPSDTLRDLKRRDDPWFEERLAADTRRGTAIAGQVAGDMAAMIPEFQRTIARLQGTIAPLAGALPGDDGPGAYDDEDY